MAKREIIIELRVDQKTALLQLGKAEASLIGLRQEQNAPRKSISDAADAPFEYETETERPPNKTRPKLNNKHEHNQTEQVTKNITIQHS